MIEYDFFETIVAGENPKDLMRQYDNKTKVDEYIIYKKSDAEFLKCKYIDSWQQYLDSGELSSNDENHAEEIIHDTLTMTAEDFFDDFTYEYDHDAEGNAVSTSNPNGKWSMYQTGKLFSIPFLTLDGREVFQAKKGDIDWKAMHLHGQEIYKRAWEMVVEGSKPKNDYEQHIFDNMKNRKTYFANFESKKMYVTYCTAFWAYAFVSDETGWKELEENINQYDWVSNFYDKFIKPLPDDTLLTIYECKK